MNIMWIFPAFIGGVVLSVITIVAREGLLGQIDKRVVITLTLILALMVLSGCATNDRWSKQDRALQFAVTGAMLCDAWTTTRIQYYDNVIESGPVASRILGENPATSDTYMYFGTLALTNYFISFYLPERWRPYWQGANIAYHGSLCMNNMAVMDLP